MTGDRGQLPANLLGEALANGGQLGIAPLGEQVELAHHPRDAGHQAVRLGLEITGVKEKFPGELFLHVGHDFQGLVVCRQQAAKMAELLLQAGRLVHFFF